MLPIRRCVDADRDQLWGPVDSIVDKTVVDLVHVVDSLLKAVRQVSEVEGCICKVGTWLDVPLAKEGCIRGENDDRKGEP